MTKPNPPGIAPTNPYKFNVDLQRLALNVLAETGNRQAACDAAQINMTTFTRLMRMDATFKECVAQAKRKFVAHLESLAMDLAKGTEHTKPGPGGVMYTETKYHPTILLALLKRFDRENWGDKKETTINHNHNQQIGLDKLTQEQRDQLQAIILSQLEPAKEIDVDIGPAQPVESESDARPRDEPPTDVS